MEKAAPVGDAASFPDFAITRSSYHNMALALALARAMATAKGFLRLILRGLHPEEYCRSQLFPFHTSLIVRGSSEFIVNRYMVSDRGTPSP
jgi:hypothetical protein